MMHSGFFLNIFIFSIFMIGHINGDPYYGARIGKFSTHFHDVKGDVYAIDEKTIFIKNFNYDGKGTDTFFWAGTSIRPDPSGFVVPDERGLRANLNAYSGKDIILLLPDDKNVKDIRWLAVWSKRFRANFGGLIFPKTLHPPRPVVIGPLSNTKHGVSSGDILIVDTQTLLVPNFSYDGTGSEACWWLSRGMKPNTGGIQLTDEKYGMKCNEMITVNEPVILDLGDIGNGTRESRLQIIADGFAINDSSLKTFMNETVVISLPESHSIFDYNTLSVWSKTEIDDYGIVKIVTDIKVPPSVRSLGITLKNKLNCEMLNDNLGLEARWSINENQLLMQLRGNLGANEYMALGFSKDDTETKFTSADAVITWISDEGHGNAVDYFLQNTDKCEDGHGMCPDTVHTGAKNNVDLLDAIKENNSVMVTFRRPLKAADEQYDQNIYTDGPQAVLWAVGHIAENGEPGPSKLRTRGNLLLDFGREPIWNCPSPETTKLTSEIISPVPKNIERIHCPIDRTFRAQLGPRIQEDEPERIWYINGLPTPILTVRRGETYTFIVEGGNTPPSHHPLYITSSAEGGLYQKILEANEDGEAVFAGVVYDPLTQALLPTAEGRLCEWSISTKNPEYTIIISSMKSQLALSLNCDPGQAGILSWTPDGNTSDIIYYQSFTEKNLGSQIRVVDFCEETNSGHYLEEFHKEKNTINEKQSTNIQHKESDRERDDSEKLIKGPVLDLEREHNNEETLSKVEQKPFNNPINTQEFFPEDEKRALEASLTAMDDRNEESIFNDVHKFLSETNRPINTDFQNVPVTTEREHDKTLTAERSDIIRSTFESHASENILSVYPYDESERSDSNVLEIERQKSANDRHQRPTALKILPKTGIPNSLNSHAHLPGEATKFQNPASELNVQFEGGFVPLVLNPSKERESVVHLDYIQPPHLRRPHRPFLFNESIPFHGTFKPGIPDFSGFNISHYTQEASLYEPNHLTDHIALLSAPKPQLIQRGISPMNGLPLELFRRPNDGITRSQMINYGGRPQILQLPSYHHQQLLIQLPSKHQQNFLIPGQENEDLDEGSSQRVQISLQTSNDKNFIKDVMTGIPLRQQSDRNRHPGLIPPKLIAPSPPIQRRPDVVEEEDVNYSSKRRPLHPKFHPPHIPNREQSDINAKIHPIRLHLPGIRRPQPFRRPPMPEANNGFKDHRRPIHQRIPHARPNLLIKTSNILVPPPSSISRPHSHHEISQDSPFVYQLPDRPLLHRLKPALKTSNVHDTRQQSATNHQLPFNGHTDISDDTPVNDNVAYEVVSLPKLLENGNRELLLSQNNDKPKQTYNKVLPKLFTNPDINLESYSANLEHLYTKQKTIEQQTRQSSVTPYPIEANITPKFATLEKEIEDQNYEEKLINPQFLLADTYSNAKHIDHKILEQKASSKMSENKQIISVEKSETQEIHLPPIILQNTPQDTAYLNLGEVINAFGSKPENLNFSEISSPDVQTSTHRPITTEANPKFSLASDIKLPQEHFPRESEQTSIEEKAQNKVPFGARLNVKLPPNDNVRVKPIFQQPHRPAFIGSRRQPQFSSIPPKEAHSISLTTSKPAKQLQMNNLNLYFNSAVNKSKGIANSHLRHVERQTSTYKPVEKEKISLTYPGRKNILPSNNNHNHPPLRSPPKAPENIQLPHISESPPSNDNGTDYSILSHVLSLIGGQPQPVHQVASHDSKVH